jgi:hypothetical protein
MAGPALLGRTGAVSVQNGVNDRPRIHSDGCRNFEKLYEIEAMLFAICSRRLSVVRTQQR